MLLLIIQHFNQAGTQAISPVEEQPEMGYLGMK